MSISGLYTAASGLQAAQVGLGVTGHNMSNVYTNGYSRQRALQTDFLYKSIGNNGSGLMQVGLGTDVSGIYQIRDKYLDQTYRTEVSRLSFYDALTAAGLEVELIIGELLSDYGLQSVFQDLWDSFNELSMNPSSLAARNTFVSNCESFVTKVNDVSNRLNDYQNKLNDQVIEGVKQANTLLQEIHELNGLIAKYEMSGDHANDYRDTRNLKLDQLSVLLDIDYRENPDGKIVISCEGNEILSVGGPMNIGLKYTAGGTRLVEPVITNETGILAHDTDPKTFTYFFNYNQTMDAANNADSGNIKGLIMARGLYPANYTTGVTYPVSINYGPSYTVRDETPLFNQAWADYQKDLEAYQNQLISFIRTSGRANPPTSIPKPPDPYHSDYAAEFADIEASGYVDAYYDYMKTGPNPSDTTAYPGNTPSSDMSDYQNAMADYYSAMVIYEAEMISYLTGGRTTVPPKPELPPLSTAGGTFDIIDPSTGLPINSLPYTYSLTESDFDDEYLKDLNLYKNGYQVNNAKYLEFAGNCKADKYAMQAAQRNYFNNYQCLIPQVQHDLDTMFSTVIKTINDFFAPVYNGKADYDSAPWDLNGNQSFNEIFVRQYVDRFDGTPPGDLYYNGEDPNDKSSLYTMGNIIVNPIFTATMEGYNELATARDNTSLDDNSLVLDIMNTWKSRFLDFTGDVLSEGYSVDAAYKKVIVDLAGKVSTYEGFYNAQEVMVMQTQNDRLQVMGVSLDEEMKNMMIYQHAYNAAARVLNTIDGMLDKLVNGTGRAGL